MSGRLEVQEVQEVLVTMHPILSTEAILSRQRRCAGWREYSIACGEVSARPSATPMPMAL